MQLKVQIPGEVFIDEPVQKIMAEAQNGFFCLEPRHIDFVAALVPGLIIYLAEDGVEKILATDEGILVKCGQEVLISTFSAIPGKDLDSLRQMVTNYFKNQNEEERLARSAAARLEAGIVRRFIEMEKLP
ncbi:MAG: F0F1 ATP synthase subunit epsilon [Gammaproteobacteria bacterium]|jgi:F-type H+-transporting ATPase subunit epsilon|nr:F0F1 ATP synthase subunit epsilon [Gammaproteobacteria bacterium]